MIPASPFLETPLASLLARPRDIAICVPERRKFMQGAVKIATGMQAKAFGADELESYRFRSLGDRLASVYRSASVRQTVLAVRPCGALIATALRGQCGLRKD
jgi:hypothetical protein